MEHHTDIPAYVVDSKLSEATGDSGVLLRPDMTERFRQLGDRHERQRLEREVIEAARVLDKKFQWHGDFVGIESARAYNDFKQKMQALNKFEAENKVE